MHDIRSTLVRGQRRDPIARKQAARSGGGGSLTALSIRREEARRCDQRREGRQLDVVETAEITFQRRRLEAAVLNVSSRGAMIQADIQPRIGARLGIRFADCNPTQCFVRWVRDGRIGLEFDKETLVIAPRDLRDMIIGGRRAGEQPTISLKKERPARQSLILRGQLHWGHGVMATTLRNVSASGAMLDAAQDLPPGTKVVLELPGVVAASASVRWCRSSQIGIHFDAPLDLTSLACHHHRPAQPDMLKPDYLRSELDPNSPWAARWQRLMAEDL
ncbi:MAG: PilZ domain-containing protein [Pseudomonadota bacterium]|nr:PilZ domain-containing protein [Pseudomonadota bacterium]